MTQPQKEVCIGLFGTCGNSTWRKDFITAYELHGINFFNPQVDDWNEEFAKTEAKHLVSDDIIVFPVTSETYGTGSLAETGYSIMQALKNTQRYVIVYVDPKVDPILKSDNSVAAKESTRSRALVLAHLEELNNPNVFVVDSIEAMLPLSIELNASILMQKSIRQKYENGGYNVVKPEVPSSATSVTL